jgi:hypothetical protein
MICRSPGEFQSVVSERSGTIRQVQGEGNLSLAFSASGDPAVAIVEDPGSSMPASLFMMSVDETSRVVETLIADNLNAPRNAAIAIGPEGETAIYVGTDSSASSPGTPSEVFFKRAVR